MPAAKETIAYPEATILNHTGVPHFWYEQSGPDGERTDVLVVRATFDFSTDGAALTRAAMQQPIVLGDVYQGPSTPHILRAVVVDDGDLLPYKPATDILVRGAASAPDGKPATEWIAGIRVGTVAKSIRLHGPRTFRKSLFGWKLGPATPVSSVALDYRLAFGGCVDIPAELSPDGEADTINSGGNPAGCGWLPLAAEYRHLPKKGRAYIERWTASHKTLAAPQIEAALAPVTSPYARLKPEGLGATARWWKPRVALQGKYDEQWRETRYPLLPEEFDPRYFQCAAPELIATPHLLGDETVTMVGLLATRREMRLPGWTLLIAAGHASGKDTVGTLRLDTVRFDLQSQQASLVWRAGFSYDDPVIDVAIAASTAKFDDR